jgi:DNA-directed RNA polymerase subunit RPC12/RpoP
MPVNVKCPTCGHVCRLADDAAESEVLCPSCRSFFSRAAQATPSLLGRAPRAEAAQPPAAPNRTLLAEPEAMVRYTCPRCKRSLESPVSFAGQKLNCPGCNQRLQIPQPSTPPPPPINKTILATEEQAGAPPPVPTPPPPPASPPAARPMDELAIVEESPSKRESGRSARRESCLECGANLNGRDRVQTCSDCGSTFCSAACYREHRYYSHSRRKKKQKRRPERVQCPYCDSTERPRTAWVISQSGWILFAVLLFFFFPLCWIGLLMTEPEYRCSDCGRRLD